LLRDVERLARYFDTDAFEFGSYPFGRHCMFGNVVL
jgi:hypothetical protein